MVGARLNGQAPNGFFLIDDELAHDRARPLFHRFLTAESVYLLRIMAAEVHSAAICITLERRESFMRFMGIAFALVLLSYALAWPHPGRTDSYGCHVDRGYYHCHP